MCRRNCALLWGQQTALLCNAADDNDAIDDDTDDNDVNDAGADINDADTEVIVPLKRYMWRVPEICLYLLLEIYTEVYIFLVRNLPTWRKLSMFS